MKIPNNVSALTPFGPVIARSAAQSKFETNNQYSTKLP